jgi:hypothetical protein
MDFVRGGGSRRLLELGWFPFRVWGLGLGMVVVLLLLGLGSEGLVVEDGGEVTAADFLLCNGGLIVLGFALFKVDGALACRDSFAGTALGFPLALGLTPAAATVAEDPPDEAAILLPPERFDCAASGLVFTSFVLGSAPEFSLSAFRRAGFFLGFLAVVGSEGGWVVFLLATGLTLLALFDETGMVNILIGLRGTDSSMCVSVRKMGVLRDGSVIK